MIKFYYNVTFILQTGLGGTLFYGIGVVSDILLFPVLSLCLKSRAPGAKTFLQVIHIIITLIMTSF